MHCCVIQLTTQMSLDDISLSLTRKKFFTLLNHNFIFYSRFGLNYDDVFVSSDAKKIRVKKTKRDKTGRKKMRVCTVEAY